MSVEMEKKLDRNGDKRHLIDQGERAGEMIWSVRKMAVVAASVCLIVYLRSLACGFVNLDDPQYVYENPAIRVFDLQFIIDSFTTSYMGWWMPLTWISLAVDYLFWGLNPVGYHLTNILLHAVNTGLVVLIAARLPGPVAEGRLKPWLPLFAALLWGLHPLRVESVVWVTERKDVLNGLFSLGAILFYLRHAQASLESAKIITRDYGISLLLFLLSLMAKPVSVVLPVLFLLLDYYPLQRLRSGNAGRVVMEKIPFLVLAAATSAATLYFAAGETILVPLSDYPLGSRLLVAGYALVEYLRMSLWPTGLTHFYPILPELPFSYYAHTLLAVGLTVYVIRSRREQPWLLASWVAFILPLLPVLGLFQNGAQSHADRFTYLPAVLPVIMVVAVVATQVEKIIARLPRYGALLVMAAVLSVPLAHALLSYQMIGYWRNSGTLWSRLIDVSPVGRAYYYRGAYYLETGNYEAAVKDLKESVRLAQEAGHPEIYTLYAFLGDAFRRGGRYDEAVTAFSTAISLRPVPNFYYHRGLANKSLGRVREAEKDFVRAGEEHGPIEWMGVQ